jgi:peptidoglycan hydrolase FlgJ
MEAIGFSARMNATHQIIAPKAGENVDPAVKAKAHKAAQEFESVFLSTLLEGMFSGMKTDMPGGGGKSEKMYRSMLSGEYAKEMSAQGGLGIADHVYREILAAQETYQK